jgi:nucleotide-binding universal stress UspA family protein
VKHMFKTILAPLGGGDSDQPVLDAAAALPRLFDAHVHCLHRPLDSAEVAANSPHIPYLVGGALNRAMDLLDQRVQTRTACVRQHYSEFCKARAPTEGAGLSTALEEGKGRPVERLAFLARHHDLTIMARPHLDDGLPADVLSRVLQESGQPLLLPDDCTATLPGRAMICWKDTAASARAVTAALPLLPRAQQVLLACVDEGAGFDEESIEAVQHRLGHHGITAECLRAPHTGAPVMEALHRCAREHHADFLVMGCYSHGALRRLLFGGCTQSVLDHAELPVLLVR